MSEVQPDKACNRCGKRPPEISFYVSTRHLDRTPKTWRSICNRCTQESSRRGAWKARHQAKKTSPIAVERETVPRLPIGPFRSWLEGRILVYENESDFAAAAGVDPRYVYRWRYEAVEISLDMLDRVVLAEGSTQLWEIYPELFGVEAAA